MRTTPPIYKYTGMIAGFGLASLIIGLVIGLLSNNLNVAAWSIAGLGVFLLIVAVIIDFRKVRSAVTGTRGRFSAGSTVMVFVFIGIIIFVNFIGVKFNKSYNVNELAQFTLTSQTKDVLADMTMDVKVICFFTPNDQYGIGDYAKMMLEEYQNYTDKLDVETIDPDEHPDIAKQYQISTYQTVVFETSLGQRAVTPDEIYSQAEHAFTSAILEVTGVVQKTVYFLTGHGEATIDGEYAYASQALLDNLYNVKELDLMDTRAIPDDCSTLVIAGPQDEFNSLELQIIEDYLKNHGHVLLMVNTTVTDSVKTILSDWDLKIEEGTVIDDMAHYGTQDNPLIPRTQNYFGDYGITEIYFPGASAIQTINPNPEGLDIVLLFHTSAASWVEQNYNPNETARYNQSIETLGSRALGVAVVEHLADNASEDTPFTELMVVSDSDFASNQHFYNVDNGRQFLYLISSLTANANLVTIERQVLPYRSLVITPAQENLIRVISIGLLPLLILLLGGVIWWRRR